LQNQTLVRGQSLPIMIEPMLGGRDLRESADDFAARHAQALRIVHAFGTCAALVICDDYPARWAMPLFADGNNLLRHAELIEREVPLP
jgi:isopentenyl diphosphate isomerase/L-lactate dehydrogenase-like FMN-dependent dehydrogenase